MSIKDIALAGRLIAEARGLIDDKETEKELPPQRPSGSEVNNSLAMAKAMGMME